MAVVMSDGTKRSIKLKPENIAPQAPFLAGDLPQAPFFWQMKATIWHGNSVLPWPCLLLQCSRPVCLVRLLSG